MSRLVLFITALFQVGFVPVNIYFITKGDIAGMMIVSFIVAMFWTFNIRKAAFGTLLDRLIYALGAATGTLVGFLLFH